MKSIVNPLFLKQILYSYKISSEKEIIEKHNEFKKLILDL